MSDIVTETLRKRDYLLSGLKNNPYVYGSVIVLLLAYSGVIAPQLPDSIAVLFESTIFKILFLFMMLVIFKQNPTISLLMAIAFVLSLQTLSKYRLSVLTSEFETAINKILPDLSVLPTLPSDTKKDNFITMSDVQSVSSPVMNDLQQTVNSSGPSKFASVGQELLANTGSDEMPGMHYEGELPSNHYDVLPEANELDVVSPILLNRNYMGSQGQQKPVGYSRSADGNTFGLPTSQL